MLNTSWNIRDFHLRLSDMCLRQPYSKTSTIWIWENRHSTKSEFVNAWIIFHNESRNRGVGDNRGIEIEEDVGGVFDIFAFF